MEWVLGELIRILFYYVGGYLFILGLQPAFRLISGKDDKMSTKKKFMVLTALVVIDIIFRYVF